VTYKYKDEVAWGSVVFLHHEKVDF